ncbi:sugar ABC transporter substrate-binding protein [Suicoccus acidiformans]|uniref:Sugar ABC transporter substrate-binding protein n=1 Tax=Suicoccus acidiformans TaxID=2036206 RepID=A0A347WM74_9LACT|nr:sugar ABC transporter substrate-binding protein [Suicoccus acidiformans]AXY26181.1 sugar ABC transporter substrate-binding protein [Suicoccus acidiformans]
MSQLVKKIGALIFSLLMVVSTLTAIPVSAQDQVEITYTIWDSRQEPGLREIADDFEATNPDIKVNIQVVGWDQYWTMLEAGATGGSLPDVFWMHANEINKYGEHDMLLGLNEYIEQDGVDLTKFPEGLVNLYNINDVQYALPKDQDTVGLWYNKTLFDEAGLEYPNEDWTWDDLFHAAQTLTNKEEDKYGIAFKLSNQEGFYNFIYQNGGTVIKEDGTSGMDLPETIEGLDFFFNFTREGLSPEIYLDDEQIQALQNGKAAMAYMGSWLVGLFQENDYLKENFAVAVLPYKEGHDRIGIYNGLGNAISANTQHPEQAWKFVSYLSSQEAQEKQSRLGVAISAYEGTEQVWTESDENYDLSAYIDMMENQVLRPHTKATAIWEQKSYEILRDGYIGARPTEEVAKETAEMMNDFIRQEP